MAMSEWISVKDRLPDPKKHPNRYIVACIEPFYKSLVIDFMRYSNGVWYYDGLPTQATVTHWIPLPEPPKEDEHDEA